MASVESPEVMVLLSGGVDSSACIDFFIDFGRPPCALFVDYGQAAAKNEHAAAEAIAGHYHIPLRVCRLGGSSAKGTGVIQSRNLFLLSVAAMERPASVTVVGIGIHAGTEYADCSESFRVAAEAALHAGGDTALQISAPFVEWKKNDIFDYCVRRRVPVEATYSCEVGGPACGLCLSCRDRSFFYART